MFTVRLSPASILRCNPRHLRKLYKHIFLRFRRSTHDAQSIRPRPLDPLRQGPLLGVYAPALLDLWERHVQWNPVVPKLAVPDDAGGAAGAVSCS